MGTAALLFMNITQKHSQSIVGWSAGSSELNVEKSAQRSFLLAFILCFCYLRRGTFHHFDSLRLLRLYRKSLVT